MMRPSQVRETRNYPATMMERGKMREPDMAMPPNSYVISSNKRPKHQLLSAVPRRNTFNWAHQNMSTTANQ